MAIDVAVKGLPVCGEDRVVRRWLRRRSSKERGVWWINVYAGEDAGQVYGMEWGRRESAERAVLNGRRALYRLKVRVKE